MTLATAAPWVRGAARTRTRAARPSAARPSAACTPVRVACALGALGLLGAGCLPALAAPSEVTVNAARAFPESITSTASGEVIFGSLAQPTIFRAPPGSGTAEPWIRLKDGGHDTSLGVLADTASNTLWVCVRMPNAPAPAAAGGAGRQGLAPSHSVLRAFNLRTGRVRASYRLPGVTSLCNDISIAPDRSVFVSDTTNGRVLRLDRHAGKLDIWLHDPRLVGIDGLTFLGPALYVNNVQTGHIYRLPIGSDGKAGAPVDIALSQPLQGPDGMRAAKGKIYVAENRAGRISALTIDGDQATVQVIKDGYQMPTAVSPVGGVLWVGESKLNYLFDAKLRGQDPGPFKAYALPLP